MSSIFSGMSASHELVIICQSQLSLLVESLGVSSASVYLTDSWDGADASQLHRVAVVPIEAEVSRNLQLSAGGDRKSTRLNSSHRNTSRMPSSA